jgi:hypothetical protein
MESYLSSMLEAAFCGVLVRLWVDKKKYSVWDNVLSGQRGAQFCSELSYSSVKASHRTESVVETSNGMVALAVHSL